MADPSLIYSWGEKPEEAIDRNKEMYVKGQLSLPGFSYRVERILKWEKEGCPRG